MLTSGAVLTIGAMVVRAVLTTAPPLGKAKFKGIPVAESGCRLLTSMPGKIRGSVLASDNGTLDVGGCKGSEAVSGVGVSWAVLLAVSDAVAAGAVLARSALKALCMFYRKPP
jgi:hypothetical protein